jgi:hypothetical protein
MSAEKDGVEERGRSNCELPGSFQAFLNYDAIVKEFPFELL